MCRGCAWNIQFENCVAALVLLVQARSQESQLEFAHQQLDMRAQELRAAAQLQDTLHSLTEQLNRTRQEAEAGV